MHVTLAVLTNRPRASLDELLSFLGIKDFFDPSPLAMKFSLEQLEIESESNKKRVLYVGDDLPDCICGKEAGIATVLVPHARKFEELRSHFTYALSDMSELISLCSSGKT
ncbi:uncharacterized protein MONOS_17495 [Monocercomonoides exilis]|uniref:uncharacterized protein n=1 Tax=Monocercomonoides exilis TaxID=2049356 RepID=UPI00355A723B|nr:hypothetical protein MONOS_17495 [Monocercomonoides exilis]